MNKCPRSTSTRGNRGSWSVGNFSYFDQRLTTTSHFAAAAGTSLNLADEGEPERVVGRRVTHDFFALFGITPALGRTFTEDEDQPGRTNVVVLSHRLWQRRFNADRGLVGRAIRINGEQYDVIGVMPPGFDQIGDAAEAWIPIGFTPAQLAMFDEFYLDVYARHQPEFSLAQVNDEFVRVARNLATDQPAMNAERSAGVERVSAIYIGDYRLRLFILLAAVGLAVIALVTGIPLRVSRRAALKGTRLEVPFALEITHAANRHQLDDRLVAAIVEIESSFDPRVVSPRGAIGLMQIMPELADESALDPFDPRMNLELGARYFSRLLQRYGGNVELALAAYNAGPGAVDRFGGVPPYRETQNYVAKVGEIAGSEATPAGTSIYRIVQVVDGRERVLFSTDPAARINPAALPPSDPASRTPAQVLRPSAVFRAP